MAQRLIKINLEKHNCKGIYYEDTKNQFSCDEITSQEIKKIELPFKLILRSSVQRKGKTVTSKKTFSFDTKVNEQGYKIKVSFKQAIEQVSAHRDTFKHEVATQTKQATKTAVETLSIAWDKYLDEKEQSKSLSDKNIKTQKLTYNKWIRSTIGDYPIDTVECSDLQNIVNDMLAKGKAPRTAKLIQDYLRPLFSSKKIHPNPAQDISLPVFDNAVKFDLPESKTKQLMDAMKNYDDTSIKGIYSFLLDGRRLGEVLLLEWSSIDYDNNIYTVQSFTTKNRKTAQYHLREETLSILREIQNRSSYIFPAKQNNSNPMSKETFRNHWDKLTSDLNIKMRVHDIRHLIGGTLVNSGSTLEEIAAVLGHSTTHVTKRYSNVKKATASRAVNKFHDVITSYTK